MPRGHGHIIAAVRRWLWIPSISFLLGVGLLYLSARLDEWASDLLINIGSSLLLVVPLALAGWHFERAVEGMRSDTKEQIAHVQDEVKRFQDEQRKTLSQLRQEYTAQQAEIRKDRDRRLGDLTSTPSLSVLNQVFHEHISLGDLSADGVRVKYASPDLYAVLTPQSQGFQIIVSEYLSTRPRASAVWEPTEADDLLGIIARINSDLERSALLDVELFDLEVFLGDFRTLIETSSKTRRARLGDDPGPARMLVGDQWMLFNEGIGTTARNPRYFVEYSRLGTSNWRKHVGEKTWVDEDAFDNAMTWAEYLGLAVPPGGTKTADPYRQ